MVRSALGGRSGPPAEPVRRDGRTIVGEHTIEWGPRDIFVVPAWYPHHHEAATDAFAFSFSDQGLHQKLGLFRERRGNQTG